MDDDYDIRTCVAEVFRDEGYEVEAVSDGVEALAAINRARPALMMLDLMMPRMSGHDVLRELTKSACSIPVVVMTAAGYAQTIRGLPVLIKPLHVDDLLRAARAYLS